MTNSILNSVKKVLGIEADYTEFDQDIIFHINSVFAALDQIGVGPEGGFSIEDDVAVWDDFTLGDKRLNLVKTYVSLKVRIVFDPPATSFVLDAMQKMATEYEWRLNLIHENSLGVPVAPSALTMTNNGDGTWSASGSNVLGNA